MSMEIFKPNVEKMKTDKNLKGLLKALGYQRDEKIRKAVAGFLGQIGDPLAVEPLITVLGDKCSSVRVATAKALGDIGDPRAIEPLVAALKDKDRLVREAAAVALGKIGGTKAVEPLIAVLEDKNWGRDTIAAAGALGEIGDPRAVEPLIAKLFFGDEHEKKQQARFRRGEISSYLNLSRDLREVAAKALGEIADSRAMEPLITALGDKEPSPRKAAAGALVKIGDPKTIDLLISYLIKLPSNNITYVNVVDIFVKIGDPAVESLIAAFRERLVKKQEGSYNLLAKVLGKIGDPRAIESLITAIEDGDGAVSQAAAEALGKIGDPCAVEPLIKALTNESWELQCAAARALGEIGDSRGVEPLISIVVNPGYYPGSDDRSSAAASALCKIYREGKIDMASKKHIYAVRDKIKYHVPGGMFPG